MRSISFFEGKRHLGHLDWKSKNNRSSTSCDIFEEWRQILSRTVMCGDFKTRKITREVGIEKVQREDLESFIKAGYGIPKITILEAELHQKIGLEFRFNFYQKEEEETFIKAPPKGIKTLNVFQLVRTFKFQITDISWFSHKTRKHPPIVIDYRSDHFWDFPMIVEEDPNCSPTSNKPDSPDGWLTLHIKNTSLSTFFKKIGDGFSFPYFNMVISKEELYSMITDQLHIPKTSLPHYLQFITSFKGDLIPVAADVPEYAVSELLRKLSPSEFSQIFTNIPIVNSSYQTEKFGKSNYDLLYNDE